MLPVVVFDSHPSSGLQLGSCSGRKRYMEETYTDEVAVKNEGVLGQSAWEYQSVRTAAFAILSMLHQVNRKRKIKALAQDDQRMVTRRRLLAKHPSGNTWRPAGNVGVTVSSVKAT